MGKGMKIIGATLDWTGKACILFNDDKIFGQVVDKKILPEYYQHRNDFPCDPKTGKELEIK